MSLHRTHPDSLQTQEWRRGGWRRRPAAFALALLLAAVVPVRGQELRFTTGNDLFSSSRTPDDHYTFAVGLEAERGAYTLSFRENAFTDRAAGLRFDETSLNVGRDLLDGPGWQVRAEGGLLHVGHGLFGQSTQNAVHRLLDQKEVELRYRDSRIYPRLALSAERSFALGQNLSLGPVVELDSVPGLRSFAVAGARALWRPSPVVALEILAGGRFTDASYRPLEPHLARFAAVARVGLALYDRVVLTWTSNQYGDQRKHLSLGIQLKRGGAQARLGSMSQGTLLRPLG